MKSTREGLSSWQGLEVWKKAHVLALEVYRAAYAFPSEERFVVTSQLLRAVVSVPTNIAEGKGRRSAREYRSFISIARGSIEEVRYLLLLSRDLDYLSADDHQKLDSVSVEIAKMLTRLMVSLSAVDP